VRLPYEYTLLPGNIERCQWVNRYYRIKVLSNAAGLSPTLYGVKTEPGGEYYYAQFLRLWWRFFYLEVRKMDDYPSSSLYLCIKIEKSKNLFRDGIAFSSFQK
jgi:hypothetical protein